MHKLLKPEARSPGGNIHCRSGKNLTVRSNQERKVKCVVKCGSEPLGLCMSGCEPYISRQIVTSEFRNWEKWDVLMHKL
jgi:hypothetical protein